MLKKAVFFDAGHTLVHVFGEGKAELLRDLVQGSFLTSLPLDWYKGARVMEAHFQLSHLAPGYYRSIKFRVDSLKLGLETAGLAHQEARSWAERLAVQKPKKRFHLDPEALPVLQALKVKGIKLALVSNWDGSLEKKVKEWGIASFFDAVLDSAVVGWKKPNPRLFQLACESLAVQPEEVLHVGDIYVSDVLGARRAGLDAVLFDPLGVGEALFDCCTIRRLGELLNSDGMNRLLQNGNFSSSDDD
jgi:putative hydrolase of the HAD superfamily